jgi:hypothetical protein
MMSILMLGINGQFAIAAKPWSGKIIYDVQPMNSAASEWDYLPQTITYETNGKDWRITEQGTSFERIWIGEFDAAEFSVLFHFLGHAVELLEPCPNEVLDGEGQWFDAPAPCAWSLRALPKSCILRDGPASFRILVHERTDVPIRNWEKNTFVLPEGYEPMDRMSLSALLTSLTRGQN